LTANLAIIVPVDEGPSPPANPNKVAERPSGSKGERNENSSFPSEPQVQKAKGDDLTTECGLASIIGLLLERVLRAITDTSAHVNASNYRSASEWAGLDQKRLLTMDLPFGGNNSRCVNLNTFIGSKIEWSRNTGYRWAAKP
jgi:hypothetical protein